MKIKSHLGLGRSNTGWTVRELFVVLGIIGVLAAMAWPVFVREKAKARRIACVNNLKQISTGFRLFPNDCGSIYPDQVFARTNMGGSENLWRLFQMAGSDISSPKVLVCPEDSQRKPAGDFLPESDPGFSSNSFSHPSLGNQALSYFYALGADEGSPQRLLMGDRNLTRDPKASDQKPGNVLLSGEQGLGSASGDTKDLRWSTSLHNRAGNVAFMDGSAQQLTNRKLREALRNSPDATNRIWLPN